MSCRGPANHNSVALILPHKSMVSFLGGAIGADIHNDRSGIHCRSVTDSAKVLDALRDPVNGYYDPRDAFTTVPRASVLTDSYAGAANTAGSPGSLKGVRIGIIRESMLTFPGIKADEPIAQPRPQRKSRTCSAGHLGATLVESTDPLWPDDPQIENMQTTYTRALAELVPIFFPELLYRVNGAGQPMFAEFAAADHSPPNLHPAARSDRERWRRWITWWGWRKGGFHRQRAEHSYHSDACRRAIVPVSRRPVPCASGRGLGGPRFQGNARRTGRR